MGIYTDAVQKLYVAYFNRPADAAGLTYWEGVVTNAKGSTAAVSAAFAASAEYKAAFAGMDAYNVVATIYQNLFGHAPDLAGLTFWGQGLLNKAFTVDTAVAEIAKGALTTDKVAYDSKVAAATAFSAALDTPAEVLGYMGDAANLAAKNWMKGITDDASLKAALAGLDATVLSVTTPVPVAQSYTLTAGVDTINGGAGNDSIIATNADGDINLTTFDNVDGGAGVDTIAFVDIKTATGTQFAATNGAVKNVEIVNITTTGGVNLSTKAWTGVTDVTVSAAGTADASVAASGTTNVTLNSATTGLTGVTGGKAVTVALTAATAGAVNVTGAALTNVSIKGGAIATVDNIDGSATPSGKGTSLTTVTLDGVTGATASLSGASLANVSLKNIAQADAITVTNATASHGLNISVDGVGYSGTTAVAGVTVADAVATSLTVHANGKSNLGVAAGLATKVTIDGSAALILDVAGLTNAKFAAIDASAATGAVTLKNIANTVTSIMTGAGADTFTVTAATVADDTTTTDTDETVNATVSSGAGNDKITVAATGTGKVTIDAGAGNDTVNLTSRTGVLNISLGDGNDTLTAAVGIQINGTDSIDAGAGVDTLTLNLVGASNIGAFSNFDVFDAAALAKTLDVDILATKNTVTEFIASGNVGASAALTNVGAGVGVRATGDMGASSLSISQKAAGALTVTVDADETGTATDTADARTAAVVAENATSLKAVFDTSYLASTTAEKLLAVDNTTTLNLTGKAAASLEIVSGGALSNNVLSFADTNNKLATITVSGAQHLDLTVTSTKLGTVDASAATGGLSFATSSLADGGKVILGSGVDTITVTTTSVATGMESIQGFEKTGAIAISTKAVDATAAGAAIADADTLVFAGAHVAADGVDAVTHLSAIKNGVLTFTGAGPSTLADAIVIADGAASTAGDAVVFEYLGNSYAFVQGGATDVVVKLVGTVGVTSLFETGGATLNDHFILV
jgi:hypothetical protein